MVTVAIVGGGQSGDAIRRAVEAAGASVELFSRSTGFDVLQDDAAERLSGADVIVEATGLFTASRSRATDFFTRSTRAIAGAVRTTGARHVLLSIVNCDLPEVQGYGYFAGKAAQERVARSESTNLTIVKTTQWFEFADQTLAKMGRGPAALIPLMKIQPVALDAVARVVADIATRADATAEVSVAGPEAMTLWDMTRRIPRSRVLRVPLALPGETWRAFRSGALLPGPSVETVGPCFTEWLAARRAS